MMQRLKITIFFGWLSMMAAAQVASDSDSVAATLSERLDSLLLDPMFETSQVGLMVYDLTADSALYAYNHRQLLRPASTMKLVTSITALDCLGPRHQYVTRLYYTGVISDSTLTGDLYCVGGFDPMLTIDDVATFAEQLQCLGVRTVHGRLLADCTMKEALDYGEGWCWDDDNPLLSPLTIGRKTTFLSRLATEMERVGIVVDTIATGEGRLPKGARQICSCRHGIEQVLQRMMKESDNFYAESMFYQTAASSGHRPAKATDARNVTKRLISRLGLGRFPYRIADGSGLSLYNYVSAELETMLLRYAFLHPDIFDTLLPALPVAGVDGTLKKRMTSGPAYANVCAKTGTLTGISSLAGYCTAADGHLLCFAIINQGIMRQADGRGFQDRVCQVLCEP